MNGIVKKDKLKRDIHHQSYLLHTYPHSFCNFFFRDYNRTYKICHSEDLNLKLHTDTDV